jgi:tetratricopeptide (TPR) repeat protein
MRRRLLLLLPLAVLLFATGFSTTFSQAGANTQSNREQSALALYQKAASLFQERQYEQSITALDEALKLNPRLVPALTLRARLAMAVNRFDLAKASLLQAVEFEPGVAENHFLLGFCYYVDNDFKNALPPLERSRQLKPDNARTYFFLALTWEALARLDEAIASYEQSLKLEKNGGEILADTLVAYARLLFTLGRYSESEAMITRALAAAPDSRDAHYEKGRLLYERRAYAEAIRHGQKALELAGAGTSERQIHFLLARAYAKSGQQELAEIHLAKFRAAPPTLRR